MDFSIGRDILPNSVAKTSRGEIFRNGVWWVKVYCANCATDGPYVVKQHLRPGQVGQPTYAHYLCNSCFEKHGVPVGHQAIPDELFWEEAHNLMMETYGRILSPVEMESEVLKEKSALNKLVLERFSNKKFNGVV